VRLDFRNACLLPYINLESLTNDPAKFLNLLYNRIQHNPEQWAPYDNFLLIKQWEIGALKTVYNPNCIIMHGLNYGKLAPWNDQTSHGWTTIGFPRAILVLEAQEKLLGFLRGVVERLVEGAEIENGTENSDAFGKALELGLRISNETSGRFEFASAYLNQPFCAPPVFDIRRLLSIAQLQLNMHGDHLWLLQTDASYTRRYVRVVLAGEFGETLNKNFKDGVAALQMYRDAVIFWFWSSIMAELQNLQALHSKFEGKIRPELSIPEPYGRALASLEALLEDQIARRAKHIEAILPFRPGFSQKWEFENRSRLQTVSFRTRRRGSGIFINLFFEDRLECCLLMLADPDQDPAEKSISKHTPRYEYSTFFAALEDHLAQCRNNGRKDELARLDEAPYCEISNVAAIHHMLSILRLHLPRVPRFDPEKMKYAEESKSWRYVNKHFFAQDPHRKHAVAADGGWKAPEQIPQKEDGAQKIKAEQLLAKLLNEFLATPQPIGSKLRSTWLEQNATQQAALASLWAGMRDRHRQTLERLGFDDADIQSDLKMLSADSDPDYVRSVQAERDDIRARIAQKVLETQKAFEQQASILSFEPNSADSQQKNESTGLKIKVKTRTESNRPELSNTHVSSATADLEDQPNVITVAVTKSAFSVFRSMFPSRISEEPSQKEVRWDSFVQAMAESEVGFVARRSSGGSAVQFEPNESSKWFGKGKIVFHKPHPVPVIDPVMLLSMGKRMRKWFGWNEETFVLEEKK